jgi:hypothetical protein
MEPGEVRLPTGHARPAPGERVRADDRSTAKTLQSSGCQSQHRFRPPAGGYQSHSHNSRAERRFAWEPGGTVRAGHDPFVGHAGTEGSRPARRVVPVSLRVSVLVEAMIIIRWNRGMLPSSTSERFLFQACPPHNAHPSNPVGSGMSARRWSATFADQVRSMTVANVRPVMVHGARPDEVANAVLFLVSDRSVHTIGGEVFVDGSVKQI